jgi:membrane-bound lytic murein transglycosylase B
MLNRRVLLTSAPLAWPSAAFAAARPSFDQVLASVRREALAQGMRAAVVDAALRGITPDPSVVRLDKNQPEFKLSWAQYRARVLPAGRLARAREAYAANAPLLAQVGARYGVDARMLIGFWGIESGFGAHTGTFNVIRSLATLVYDGRRAEFFRKELLGALRILSDGDRAPDALLGSWAGAMGQPQFLPSFYLRYAVDFDGDGKRDIWTSVPDIFASIANFMQINNWRAAEPWGQQIALPPGFAAPTGRGVRQSLGAWMALGVRRFDGTPFSRADVQGAVIQPDGAGGEAFMVYPNFDVIRRYNPSDYYALGVGLLGYAAL